MKPSKGYYSIIQYNPNLSRFEAANVGVLLFCPERGFLKALTTRGNARIIRFFGAEGHDWERINAFKRGLEDRLQAEAGDITSVDDLRQFIALRANVLQITPPLPMKVVEPEQDLADLYEQIVGEPARKAKQRSFRSFVGSQLCIPDLERKVIRNVKVQDPVRQKDVEIPFGFRNGRFNLINPVQFGAQDPGQSADRACVYAVEGRAFYEHPHPDLGELQLIVVGWFRPKDRETPARVARVFSEYNVRLYRSDQLPALVDEIRRTGQDVVTPNAG